VLKKPADKPIQARWVRGFEPSGWRMSAFAAVTHTVQIIQS
jgi:hypothetical protein